MCFKSEIQLFFAAYSAILNTEIHDVRSLQWKVAYDAAHSSLLCVLTVYEEGNFWSAWCEGRFIITL